MVDQPGDIHVKQFGPQLQILDRGRAVAVALTADDNTHHRLIAATSLIGNLIAYLSRARSRAIERLDDAGIRHQVTTGFDTGALIDPKSVTLAVAKDTSHAVLQVTDDKGSTISLRLAPDLTATLAQQMTRASQDMSR